MAQEPSYPYLLLKMPTQNIEKANQSFIANLDNLYSTLEITEPEVQKVINLPTHTWYTKKNIKKKDGSERTVYAPHAKVKRIQKKIKSRILADENIIKWPSYVYGSLKNTVDKDGNKIIRDYVACASQHTKAKSLLTVDIEDFFDNVNEDVVEETIKKYISKDKAVAEFLLKMCCFEGRLIQGAPTSSYFASMSLYNIEPRVKSKLTQKNLTYTRFVDDITVSCKIHNYNFTYALKVIEDALTEIGLFLNQRKIQTRYAGAAPLTVHGLRVDFHNARLPSEEIKNIRANVRMIEKMASQYKIRTSFAYKKEYARCMGRVNKLKRTGHHKHEYYLNRLKKVRPIPSRSDIKIANKKLKELIKTYPDAKASYYYKKKYYWLAERLYILRRSFPASTNKMLDKLKNHTPEKTSND